MLVQIMQLVISMLLFFVLFFGIGFIVNMLLHTSWLMAFVYPIVVILIVDEVKLFDYLRVPSESLITLWENLTSLGIADMLILSSGLFGAIGSGLTIKTLRKSGYLMF